MSENILLAVGGNLPDATGRAALATCQWAVSRLAALPGLRLVAVSPWYCSAPVPPSDQPDYINGVARFAGEAEPHALLAALHAIEAEAGRIRGERNAARVLDLDLLGIDDQVVNTPDLVLPHPRLAERAFVLVPLCDVAPDWVHPVLGRTARALCKAVNPGGIRPA